jgi:hypothetical protein
MAHPIYSNKTYAILNMARFSLLSKAKIEQTLRGDGDATLAMNRGGR